MEANKLVGAYNAIIRPRFPTIRVLPAADDLVMALGIRDEDGPAFSSFIINELGDELRSRGLEFCGVVTYSMEATRIKFSEIWEEIQNSMAALTKVKKEQATEKVGELALEH